ncbi:MAG: hypothetical protein LBT68_06250, partial [Spirochaetales bacterium]|nr:hypothetical protein [Spirochaetales bacterium]
MGGKTHFFRCVFPALLFLVPCFAPAQEDSFYIQRFGEEVRFIQRLAWEKQEYAYRYEVIIQKREAAGFTEHSRDFTSLPLIEVSLAPGEYRCGIIAYDLFDSPGEMTPWMPFKVLPALQPELRDFSPKSFFLDEDTLWDVSLDGRDLA